MNGQRRRRVERDAETRGIAPDRKRVRVGRAVMEAEVTEQPVCGDRENGRRVHSLVDFTRCSA